MHLRRRCLMLILAVVIGGGLIISRSTDGEYFRAKDEPYKSSLEPNAVLDAFSKQKQESFEQSRVDNYSTLHGSQIKKELDKKKIPNTEPPLEPSRKRIRRHSRKKRNAEKDSKGWFFTLKVTRPQETLPLSNSNKDPRFGIAVRVQGGVDSDDVQVAWDNVQTLVQNLFGGSYEELSKTEHDVIIDLSGLPNNAQTELKNKEHLDEVQQPKGKEAKFFLGLFPGNREKPTTEKISVVASSSISPPVKPSEIIPTTERTHFPNEVTLGFEEKPSTQSSETESDENSELLNKLGWTTTFKPGLPKVTEQGDLLENVNLEVSSIESLNFSTSSNIKQEGNSEDPGLILGTPTSSESSFSVGVPVSPEQLTEFCVSLLERIQKSHRSVQDLSLENSTAEDKEGASETGLTTETTDRPKRQNSGFFANLLNRLVGRNGAKPADSIGASKRPKTDDKGDSLFNRLVWNSDRGRSLESEIKNLQLEDDMNETLSDDHNVTVSECEIFFQNWLNMDQDSTSDPLNTTSISVEHVIPDVLEITTRPNEIENLENVENSSASGFLNMDKGSTPDLLNTTSLNVENIIPDLLEITKRPSETENFIKVEVENSFDEDLKSSSSENSLEDSTNVISVKKFTETTTLGIEEHAISLNEIASNRPLISEFEGKDERNLEVFNVGSGAREISVDIDGENLSTTTNGFERGLPDLDLNEENYKTEDISIKALEVTTEDEGRRFIGFLNMGSGERQLGEESEFTNDYIFTASLKTEMVTYPDTNGNTHQEHFSNYDGTDLSHRSDEVKSTTLVEEDLTTEDDAHPRRFLDFLNMGSGRDLSESDDSGEYIYLPEGLKCFYDNRTGEVKCSDGSPEEIALRKSEKSTSSEDGHNVKGGEPDERFFLSGNSESTAEIVMKDHEDPTTSTMLPPLSPRGSRALDDPIVGWRDSDSDEMHVQDEFVLTPRPKDLNPLRGRRGRFEDSSSDEQGNSNDPLVAKIVTSPDIEVGDDSMSLDIVRKGRTDASIKPETTVVETSTESLFVTESTIGIRTTGGHGWIQCNDHDDCDSDLNEKCVEKERRLICGCEDGFVRSINTKICSKSLVVDLTMKFPLETYHPDLNDTSSDKFEKTKMDFAKSIKLLLDDMKLLQDMLVDIEIKRFEPGSLIVHANLVFAKPKEMTATDIVKILQETLKNGVKESEFLDEAPLKMKKSKVLKIAVEGDLCSHGSFKCHENATCIPEEHSGYTCKCKEGFVDVNLNGVSGKECEACPAEFCSGNGICKVTPDRMKYCECIGWNVGTQCTIPGTMVIGGVAAFNGLFLLCVLIMICLCRRRKAHASGQYGGGEEGFGGNQSGRSSAVPSHLRGDTVAMSEMGESVVGSKYASRSTPRRFKCPDINIISPSNIGSDQSSVFDSTFDRSTCEQDVEENV